VSVISSEPSGAEPEAVLGLDYVELFVGNARQTTYFYTSVLGLPVRAYAGFETGQANRSSYLLAAGDVPLVISAPVSMAGPIAEYVGRHGDGVRDIAFAVDKVDDVFDRAIKAGAAPLVEPTVTEWDDGVMTSACVGAFGDVVHSLVQRQGGRWRLPGLAPATMAPPDPTETGVKSIDHLAVCLDEGRLDRLVEFYTTAFGFHESFDDYVATSRSAMRGRVVESANASIRLPLWEAGEGLRGSQVSEFVQSHNGPGIQHAAFLCDDVVAMTARLRERGIEFLAVPEPRDEWTPAERESLGDLIAACRTLGIVIERSGSGLLMQIFTMPLQSRPTFFWELIERRGSRSFAGGNIRALFEGVEEQQVLRGSL